jgi:hypothetical protein
LKTYEVALSRFKFNDIFLIKLSNTKNIPCSKKYFMHADDVLRNDMDS